MQRATVAVVLCVLLAGCASTQMAPAGTPTPAREQASSGSPSSTPSILGNASGRLVTVVDVVDGDTADVRYENGTTDTIRLLGVDAPETHVATQPGEFEGIPDTRAGRDWLARWGERAGEYLRRQIEGERVRIVTDERADRRGDYGRLLVYVTQEGVLLNRRLLERGYARLYDSSFALRDRFAAVEERARAADRGLWGFDASGSTDRAGDCDQRCEPPSTHSVSPVT